MFSAIKTTTITTLTALTLIGGLSAQAYAQDMMPSDEGAAPSAQSSSLQQSNILPRSSLEGFSGTSFNAGELVDSNAARNDLGFGQRINRSGNSSPDYMRSGGDLFSNRFSPARSAVRRVNGLDVSRHKDLTDQIAFDNNFQDTKLIQRRF